MSLFFDFFNMFEVGKVTFLIAIFPTSLIANFPTL